MLKFNRLPIVRKLHGEAFKRYIKASWLCFCFLNFFLRIGLRIFSYTLCIVGIVIHGLPIWRIQSKLEKEIKNLTYIKTTACCDRNLYLYNGVRFPRTTVCFPRAMKMKLNFTIKAFLFKNASKIFQIP